MTNYLDQSDDEFLKEAEPTGSQEQVQDSTPSQNTSEETQEVNSQVNLTTPQDNTNLANNNATENTQEVKSEVNSQPQTINYEDFYKKVMSPIKANGKEIHLDSEADVISLMQKGANYTKKMQMLAPYRKALYMLEQNNLLDTDTLGLLIDARKGDKEAIKKLLQDSKIDALDLDSTEPSTYQNKHVVSDEQVQFNTVYNEIASLPGGAETLNTLYRDWDSTSKAELTRNPEQLQYLHEQRMNGTYKIITDEMDRLATLGYQDVNTPFLQRYLEAGTKLKQQIEAEQAKNNRPIAQQVGRTPAQITQPVDSNLVKQAGITNANGAAGSGTMKNPLAMSDEEFMKQFG